MVKHTQTKSRQFAKGIWFKRKKCLKPEMYTTSLFDYQVNIGKSKRHQKCLIPFLFCLCWIFPERLNTKIYSMKVFVSEKHPHGNYYQVTSPPTMNFFFFCLLEDLLPGRNFTCDNNSLKFALKQFTHLSLFIHHLLLLSKWIIYPCSHKYDFSFPS